MLRHRGLLQRPTDTGPTCQLLSWLLTDSQPADRYLTQSTESPISKNLVPPPPLPSLLSEKLVWILSSQVGRRTSGWREAKKSNREEKEKSEFPFPIFEKRKRNLKTISLISRGERESWIPFPQFQEEKEKFENNFSYFERRERKLNFLSPVSRREREIRQIFSTFEKRKRKVK